ncbi:hypothetical protein FKM82_008819 [Ascaphus truei]
MMDYPTTKSSPGFFILLCSIPNILCICPLKCSCSGNNRNVDCSGRNMTALPHGLQDNVTNLNLSHNHFANLDHQLTWFTNLRSLDLSHNTLKNLPSHLPKSLWELYAANNNIKVIHKLDTAHQWNLKVLDVSRNQLQRTVLINNTLGSLQLLNLSSNQLWTVPTNMPYNIQTIDLSNNSLIQILPGTMVRMPSLQKLYLHSNRFTYIPSNAFDQLTHLQEITLYNNPWSCKETPNILYLLKWVRETTKSVKGYPCANETSHNATIYLSSLTETSDEVVAGNPLLNATTLLFLEAQETKLYKQVRFSEAATAAPLNMTSMLLASTDYSLLTDEEGSADELINLNSETFSNKDALIISLDDLEKTETSDPTLGLTISTGMAKKSPEFAMQSTTASVVIPATTIKLKDHIPSSAHKDKRLASHFLILLLVLRMV